MFELVGAQEIDFLKVDIEGSEHAVFAAADAESMRRFQRIAMEYHDQLAPGTLALLRETDAQSRANGSPITHGGLRDFAGAPSRS